MIENEPRDLIGPVHQRLVMHCLSEVASQENLKFNRLRQSLECKLKQWVMFECNFELNENRRSKLAADAEFPSEILEDLLKDTEFRKVILTSTDARPINPSIITMLATLLPRSGERCPAVRSKS